MKKKVKILIAICILLIAGLLLLLGINVYAPSIHDNDDDSDLYIDEVNNIGEESAAASYVVSKYNYDFGEGRGVVINKDVEVLRDELANEKLLLVEEEEAIFVPRYIGDKLKIYSEKYDEVKNEVVDDEVVYEKEVYDGMALDLVFSRGEVIPRYRIELEDREGKKYSLLLQYDGKDGNADFEGVVSNE